MDSSLMPLINRFGKVETDFLTKPIDQLDPPTPLTILETDSVLKAIETLQARGIGCLLITDEAGTLKGIFSERDVLTRVILKEIDLGSVAISSIMTPNPHSEPGSTSIAIALQLMSRGGYRHLPIVEENGQAKGIISVKDILDFIEDQIVNQLIKSELTAGAN